jgi:hypothetical protein
VALFDEADNRKDNVFPGTKLLQLTPEMIHRQMNGMAFGVPFPPLGAARASTLEYAKNLISSFVPKRIPQWDPQAKFGNPTKSPEVNHFIMRVTRKQVQGQRLPFSAW